MHRDRDVAYDASETASSYVAHETLSTGGQKRCTRVEKGRNDAIGRACVHAREEKTHQSFGTLQRGGGERSTKVSEGRSA